MKAFWQISKVGLKELAENTPETELFRFRFINNFLLSSSNSLVGKGLQPPGLRLEWMLKSRLISDNVSEQFTAQFISSEFKVILCQSLAGSVGMCQVI